MVLQNTLVAVLVQGASHSLYLTDTVSCPSHELLILRNLSSDYVVALRLPDPFGQFLLVSECPFVEGSYSPSPTP